MDDVVLVVFTGRQENKRTFWNPFTVNLLVSHRLALDVRTGTLRYLPLKVDNNLGSNCKPTDDRKKGLFACKNNMEEYIHIRSFCVECTS